MDNVPRGREKLSLEERGLVVSGHPVSRSLSQRDLISSFEALFAHVLHNVTSNPKLVDRQITDGLLTILVVFNGKRSASSKAYAEILMSLCIV